MKRQRIVFDRLESINFAWGRGFLYGLGVNECPPLEHGEPDYRITIGRQAYANQWKAGRDAGSAIRGIAHRYNA